MYRLTTKAEIKMFQCLKTVKLKIVRRRKSQLVVSRQVVTNQCCGLAVIFSRFYVKDCKTGLAKIVAHLTNSGPSKKRLPTNQSDSQGQILTLEK